MLIHFCLCWNTLISLFSDTQDMKRKEQIQNNYLEVHKEFSDEDVSIFQIIYAMKYFDIFRLMNGNELVASVYFHRKKYYSSISTLYPFTSLYTVEKDAVEIYSLYVNKKYRCKGYARKLLWLALAKEKEHYNMANDFIVSLHINPKDKYMNVSFSLYYSMNFRKCSFVKQSPSCLAPCFQKFKKLHDSLEIISDPDICKEDGEYLALYTKYCDLLPWNPITNKNLFNLGERLRSILCKRQKK